MNALTDLAAPIIWTCSGLAALLFVTCTDDRRKAGRTLGAFALLLGTTVLVLALAHPHLLPLRSAVVHRDGSTDDPRVLASLLVATAALLALVPSWNALRLNLMTSIGLLLPGIVLAGLAGAVASFAGLRQPMAIAGIALGALAGLTALALAVRTRSQGHAPLALQAFATSLLAVAAMLSLHGARLGAVAIPEGGAVDTLGQRMYFAGVEAPSPELRVLRVTLYRTGDSLAMRPELRGPKRSNVLSVADARLWSGPIVVPISLEERRAKAHDVQWADRTTPLRAGTASIRLAGFRFVKGDTIRMFADLDVTTPAGTERVSPGVFATAHGETPFAVMARGFGPIAIAGIDADHGRVGLILPQLSEANVSRVATLDLRLRPALPVAWGGAILALLAFVLGLVAPAPSRLR